jgi:integrase
MTAYNVQYLVAALARDASIPVHLTPHGLRHSAITIGLDAGVSLRDMQDFARVRRVGPSLPVSVVVRPPLGPASRDVRDRWRRRTIARGPRHHTSRSSLSGDHRETRATVRRGS